jgi:hypothetical protein
MDIDEPIGYVRPPTYETQFRAMPAPPRPDPPDHTFRIAYAGIWDRARWANVLWARNGKGMQPGGSELTGLAASFYEQYRAQLLPFMSNLVTLEGVQLLYYNGGSVTGGQHVENNNGQHVGGSSLPANVAVVVSWSVPERYRGGHPRTYFPGTTIDRLQNNQEFTQVYKDEVRVAADQFHALCNTLTSANVADLHMGTVSFVNNKQWRNPPVFRDFTPAAAIVDTRIDSQRRRLGPDVKS